MSIPIFEPRVAVFIDVPAWQRWIAKAVLAANGTPLIATPLEHNSAMAAFGTLMDELSDPSRFASAQQSTPLGGVGILFDQYNGPQPAANLLPTPTSTNVYHGARVPVMGAMVAPSDPANLEWWQAWREIVTRFGLRKTFKTVTAVPEVLSAEKLVLTDGVVAQAVVPLHQIPADNTLAIVEDPDASKYVNALFNATIARAQRYVNQSAGSTAATDTTASALEAAAQPQITAIANQYKSENKTSSLIGAGVLGAIALVSLAMPRGRSRGRKR